MGKKMWEQMETEFLHRIYAQGSAVGTDLLLRVVESSYGMRTDMSEKILDRLLEKEYCVVERIRKLNDTEEDIIFLTLRGVEKLVEENDIPVMKIFAKQIAYELKCMGCASYSEWLDQNREKLLLERTITSVYARALADMEIILMYKDDKVETKENLQVAIERTEEYAKQLPAFKNTVAYVVVMAIYNKMLDLLETDILLDEVEDAKKLIDSFVAERRKTEICFI